MSPEKKYTGGAAGDTLDWPFFTARHRHLHEKILSWADSRVPVILKEAGDIDERCRALVRELGEAGFLGHTVVAPHGGTAEVLDVRSLCLLRESLAYVHGLADFAFAMQGLGSAPVSLFGDDEQRQIWLPPIARGEAICGFALSETDAGSDVAALCCQYREVAGDFLLNGEKTWISNGGIADWYVVFARQGEGGGTRNLGAFIVPANIRRSRGRGAYRCYSAASARHPALQQLPCQRRTSVGFSRRRFSHRHGDTGYFSCHGRRCRPGFCSAGAGRGPRACERARDLAARYCSNNR